MTSTLKWEEGASGVSPNLFFMPIMNKLTAAYLAGLIDGEGYIGLENHRGVGGAKYKPVLKIAMTHKPIILWLQQSFGGSFVTRVRNGHPLYPNHRDLHYWGIGGKNIEPVIRKVIPYLKVKRRQAEIVLERVKLYEKQGDVSVRSIHHSGWNFKYKPEFVKRMEDLYAEIRLLNKRGTGSVRD